MIIIIQLLINHASVFDEFFVTQLDITPVMRAFDKTKGIAKLDLFTSESK